MAEKRCSRQLKEIETEEKTVGNPEPHKGNGTERHKKIQGGEKRESRLQTLVDFTQFEHEHLLRRALDKDGRLVYFISPDTLTLTEYILTLKNANFDSNERPEDIYRHMLRAAAHLMSDLHSKGCSIGDFNITNLWVVRGIVKFGDFTPTFDASEVAVRKDYSCLSLLITTVIEIEEEKELERTSRYIEVDNHRSVYVENLNHDVTESQILEVFQLYGVVEKVILHTDERRMSRGYCFIEFNCRESAESALQLNGKTLEISYQPMKVVLRKVDLGGTSSRKVGSYTPSPCLMLKGVFDPKMEPDTSAIEAAVREKCRPIQELRHIFVDKGIWFRVYTI